LLAAVWAIISFVAGAALEGSLPFGEASSTLPYLVIVAGLGVGFTVLPFVRDYPEVLLVWPGVLLILAATGLWALVGAVETPWVAIVSYGVAALLPLGGFMVAAAAVLIIPKTDRLGLVHPLLRKATQDTQPSLDASSRITVRVIRPEFRAWVRVADFLRRERIADVVRVRRDRVTIEMARVAGLPRAWAIMLLPFGRTTLRVNSDGLGIVCVNPHAYRLLKRPGPYIRYCQNIVDALSEIALLVSEGRPEEARRLARL